MLSGIPTPHAYDHLNKKEVVDENSWINRQFKAREFNVSGNAKLESSRNVSLLEGNFNARHQAQIQLGFTQVNRVNAFVHLIQVIPHVLIIRL